MAAPIWWAPRISVFFLQENLHVHKILRLGGGILGLFLWARGFSEFLLCRLWVIGCFRIRSLIGRILRLIAVWYTFLWRVCSSELPIKFSSCFIYSCFLSLAAHLPSRALYLRKQGYRRDMCAGRSMTLPHCVLCFIKGLALRQSLLLSTHKPWPQSAASWWARSSLMPPLPSAGLRTLKCMCSMMHRTALLVAILQTWCSWRSPSMLTAIATQDNSFTYRYTICPGMAGSKLQQHCSWAVFAPDGVVWQHAFLRRVLRRGFSDSEKGFAKVLRRVSRSCPVVGFEGKGVLRSGS